MVRGRRVRSTRHVIFMVSVLTDTGTRSSCGRVVTTGDSQAGRRSGSAPTMACATLTDAGPWPCAEDGCPSPSVSCATLSEHDFCEFTFDAVWDAPPPEVANRKISELCARSCEQSLPHTCGVYHEDHVTRAADTTAPHHAAASHSRVAK